MDEASVVAELLVRDGCADDREACWRHLKDPQGAPAPALSAPPGSPESAWCHTFVVDDGRQGAPPNQPHAAAELRRRGGRSNNNSIRDDDSRRRRPALAALVRRRAVKREGGGGSVAVAVGRKGR